MLMNPWTVLLVDDDDDVIEVSRMVLAGVQFEGRELRILSAHSAAAALEIFRDEGADIAVARGNSSDTRV